MLWRELDDSLIEQILCKLSPPALAAAELTCRHWSAVVRTAQLWKQHAKAAGDPTGIHAEPSSCRSGTSTGGAATCTWRDVCLHRAASARWCEGQLVLTATLRAHTGPVTCMAVRDDVILTGSSDGTARLWDMTRGKQRNGARGGLRCVLQMPGGNAVVAVALVSVSVAVTATASGAVLWRGGAAVRRFEALPGGRVTALALTDTQLVLGSTSGVVQQFNLYSGQQQLMTRYKSGVSSLLTHQQHQQQALETGGWAILVGCYSGQVVCVNSTTGQVLWELPVVQLAGVVSMRLVDLSPCPPSSHQLQQDKLLYVLNARAQLICWQLTASALSGQPTAGCTQQAGSKRSKMLHRPLAMCDVAAPTEVATQLCQQRLPLSTPFDVPRAAAQQRKSPLEPLLLQPTYNSCTCLISPQYGTDCLLIGSNLGYLTVAQLRQQDKQPAAAAAAAGGGGGAVDSGGTPPSVPAAGAAGRGIASTADSSQQAHRGRGGSQAAAPSSAGTAGQQSAGSLQQAPPPQRQQQRQQQQENGRSSHLGVHVVRHCPLHQLSTSSTSRSLPRAAAEPQLANNQVLCMQHASDGRVLVGVDTGCVLCLKLKHPAGSMWAGHE